jgi:cytochrome c1
MSMRKLFTTLATVATLAVSAPAFASGGDVKLEHQEWSWQGVFGTYDHAQLRRGYQVFREVCSTCHSLNLVRYRNLLDIGMSEDEMKEIAAQNEVQDGFDDDGEPKMRPGVLADKVHAPFSNEKMARAMNGGALPPDLSLMNKARKNGPDYVYTLLTSYEDEMPEDFHLMDGMYYNPAFPGHQIAMPQMIFDQGVEFADGAPNSKEAITADVVAFLNWAAEPELEQRKSMGVKVMIFLFVMTALFYALKRQIWSRIDH